MAMLDGSPGLAGSLDPVIAKLALGDDYYWALDHLKPIISTLVGEIGARRVLEMGGGRLPLFSPAEFHAIDVDYVVNDVSERELGHLPADYSRAQFNVCNEAEVPDSLVGQVDFVFSRMLIEHLPDTLAMYRTASKLLRPGGVGLHFHPLRYGLPFVANALLPETVTRPILLHFFPARADDKNPKFPAYYDHCIASRKNAAAIRETGYSEVKIVPFYDHLYFESIPIVREVDHFWNEIARAMDWSLLATYAYTLTRK